MGGVSGHGQKNKPHKSGRHAGRSAREKHAKSKGRFMIDRSVLSHMRRRRERRRSERKRRGNAEGISSFGHLAAADGCRRRRASRTFPLSFVSHSNPSPTPPKQTINRGRSHAIVHQDSTGEAGQAAAPAGVQGAEVSRTVFSSFVFRVDPLASSSLSLSLSLLLTLSSLLLLQQNIKTGTRKRPRSSRRGAPRPRRRGSSACSLCRRALPPR